MFLHQLYLSFVVNTAETKPPQKLILGNQNLVDFFLVFNLDIRLCKSLDALNLSGNIPLSRPM